MSMRVKLPRVPRSSGGPANGRKYLDMLGSKRTVVNRRLRREGLGGHEPLTQATLLTIVQHHEPEPVFFDVGAHVGLYSALLTSVFEERGVRATAFEPAPDTAAIARQMRDRNGLGYEVVQAAVSSEVGWVELHLSDVAETSNSLNPTFRPHSASITVPMTTLDTFVRESGVPPSVIKIDVETHEPEVLRGALDSIRTYRPWIVCELLLASDPAPLDIALKTLTDAGYYLYKLSESTPWRKVPARKCRQRLGAGTRDWLFAPTKLDNRFYDTLHAWHAAVLACTAETNRFVSAAKGGNDRAKPPAETRSPATVPADSRG